MVCWVNVRLSRNDFTMTLYRASPFCFTLTLTVANRICTTIFAVLDYLLTFSKSGWQHVCQFQELISVICCSYTYTFETTLLMKMK